MTLAEAYHWLCTQLACTPLPDSEAWEMLRQATSWQPKDLIARPTVVISSEIIATFAHWVTKRQQGMPLAYVLGKKHFWRFDWQVNPSVLIPRSDTECLIEWVLDRFPLNSKKTVLDLGTGSGAIAVTLALERPEWQLIATDLSEQALEVATSNAVSLGAGKVVFYQGSWFLALDASTIRQFDLIISNPPYIAAEDPHLQQGDLLFEPKTALVAAQQGFEALAHLIQEVPRFLQASGMLILEHGHAQQDQVISALKATGYREIQGHCDFQKNPRFVTAIRPK